MKLHGKIILVTGGNSGIGRAIALRAAAEGARVGRCVAAISAHAAGVAVAIGDCA